MNDFIRTLRPFNNLSNPHDTIYDHLPYIKDINLIDESDVKITSGNVVKYIIFDNNTPFIVDTNEQIESILAEARNTSLAQGSGESEPVDDAKADEIVDTPDKENSVSIDEESVKALSDADENEDDYSFLQK